MKDFEKERVDVMEATGLVNINIDRLKEHTNNMILNCLVENIEHILMRIRMQSGYLLDYVYKRKIDFNSALDINQIIADETLSVYNAIFIKLKNSGRDDDFIRLSNLYYDVSKQNVDIHGVIKNFISPPPVVAHKLPDLEIDGKESKNLKKDLKKVKRIFSKD